MLDLYEELKALLSAFDTHRVEYALCGGLAMAVHGFFRATIDIDLLIRSESLEEIKSIARSFGYTIEALPMTFSKGAIEIRRLSKLDLDAGDVLMLDLLVVTPQIENVWTSRTEAEWEGGKIKVVSREGLIALKSFRSSRQDLADIESLKAVEDES
jgi:hypothetical protein